MRLAPVFLGSLARRRVATLFSFIAIVLGVALGMAVQAVHEAALSEFGHGLRSMAGQADLQVVGPRGGFDEALYAQLAARPEVAEASPVLEVEAKLAGREEALQVLGVDVFALARVTPLLLPRPDRSDERFAVLDDDAVFVSAAVRQVFGLQSGDSIRLQVGTTQVPLRVAGDLPAAGEARQLAVMDIAAAQARFGKLGRLAGAIRERRGSQLCGVTGELVSPADELLKACLVHGHSQAAERSGARSGVTSPISQ